MGPWAGFFLLGLVMVTYPGGGWDAKTIGGLVRALGGIVSIRSLFAGVVIRSGMVTVRSAFFTKRAPAELVVGVGKREILFGGYEQLELVLAEDGSIVCHEVNQVRRSRKRRPGSLDRVVAQLKSCLDV